MHLSITHLVSFEKSVVVCSLILPAIKSCVHYICRQRHVKPVVFFFFLLNSFTGSSPSLCLPFSSCSIQKGNELGTFQPLNPQSTNRSFVSFSASIIVTHINKALESQQNLTCPFQSKAPCKQWQRTMWPLFTLCF